MTARENVLRHLRALQPGLDSSITITQEGPDRVYAWPVLSRERELYNYCVEHGWSKDPKSFAEAFHEGAEVSFREPGDVEAALQITFCFVGLPYALQPKYRHHPIYLDIDHDYRSPHGGIKGAIVHAGEVLWNAITGSKTCQEKISRMLDKRFGATNGYRT